MGDGLTHPLLPPKLPCTRDGCRYPRRCFRNALEPVPRGPAGLHLRPAGHCQVLPQPLIEVTVQRLGKSGWETPSQALHASPRGASLTPWGSQPCPSTSDPLRGTPSQRQWGRCFMWDPGEGAGGPGSSYLDGGGQLYPPVMLQVGCGRHQGEAVLVLHPCELPRVLGQPC